MQQVLPVQTGLYHCNEWMVQEVNLVHKHKKNFLTS